MKDFGEQGYFLNFPSKFISNNGYTLWLCYSSNFARGRRGVEIKPAWQPLRTCPSGGKTAGLIGLSPP